MRGAKVDRPVSKLLFKNRIFLDRRSFVSLNGNEPHLFLKGRDMSAQRERAWIRAKGSCEHKGCNGLSIELDHVHGGLTERCDCLHNLQLLCTHHHTLKHNRYPKFGQGRPAAIKQFEEVQNGEGK